MVSRGPWSLATSVRLAGRAVGTHHRRLDGHDLPFEAALGHGHGRLALGLEAQPVDVVTGDPVLLGDPLGRAELVGHVPGELLRTRPARAVEGVGPEADPAHGLDAAGDAGVDGVGADEVGDEVVGLLGRAALAVDRGGRHLVGQALAQPGRAGDVGGLLAGLGDATADDLLDAAPGSTPALLTSSTWALPSSSAAWNPDSHPLRFPIGVRTASTITGWAMVVPLCAFWLLAWVLRLASRSGVGPGTRRQQYRTCSRTGTAAVRTPPPGGRRRPGAARRSLRG